MRKWLAEELKAEGYSNPYVTAIGHRSRFIELRTQARTTAAKAEARGAVNAYTAMAVILVKESHGLSDSEAEKRVNEHTKRWDEARQSEESP
ncbi:hypothetical protein [Streptomyces sp. SID1121]|uniref:hypothetical protein n=1 Tax=Streptomyces sp. SID1121 TaxID=3425888 RepID=UPI0040570D72